MIRINGDVDHTHMLVELSPSVALADLVKEVKQSSSYWIKKNPNFPDFEGWGKGYFAGSLGPNGIESCIKYIENQFMHHKGKAFLSEMEWLLLKYEINWYRDDWE